MSSDDNYSTWFRILFIYTFHILLWLWTFSLEYCKTRSEVSRMWSAHLKSFRIYVRRFITTTIPSELPITKSLLTPNLESFDLYLQDQRRTNDDNEEVKWTIVEKLIFHFVMSRLRRCSLIYGLSTSAEISDICQFHFDIDERHICIQYAFYIPTPTSIDSSSIDYIRHIS